MVDDQAIDIDELLEIYDQARHDLKIHMEGVIGFLSQHPDLTRDNIIHSTKSRLKDREHLREKLARKIEAGREISKENLLHQITDLAGVRVLHLYQKDFTEIDRVIRRRVAAGDWCLGERPKAYTWDPEAVEFFGQFDLEIEEKPTFYTSVHYLIKPREDSPYSCEVQVRTLFEEIWGEVDHQLNYPKPTESVACLEQIKVLAKVVGSGSRLLDAIQTVRELEEQAE